MFQVDTGTRRVSSRKKTNKLEWHHIGGIGFDLAFVDALLD
jgi:hypothetical protein